MKYVQRFLRVDPLTKKYPELTPYQFASNTPIWAEELEGLEANYSNGGAEEPFGGGTIGEGNKTDHAGPLSDSHAQELNVVSGDAMASNFGKQASVEIKVGGVDKTSGAADRVSNFLDNGGKLGGHAMIKTTEGVLGFTGGIKLKSTPGIFEFKSQEQFNNYTIGEQMVSFPLENISLDQYWGMVDTYIDYNKFQASSGNDPRDAGFINFYNKPDYKYSPLFGFRCASSCLKVLNDNKIIQDSDFKMKYMHAVTPTALIRHLQDKKMVNFATPKGNVNQNRSFNENYKK